MEVLDDLPCVNCITLAMCRNRKIVTLLSKCRLLSTYLTKTENSKGRTLYQDRLMLFCEYMKIQLKKPYSRGSTFTYHWQRGYKWEDKKDELPV